MSTGVEKVQSRLSGLWIKHRHTSAQTVLKPNMRLFSVIKQTLIGCGCAKIRADWLHTALSEPACAAGDKGFWSGLGLYLQSRWLAWFKIAQSQSGCSWKTRRQKRACSRQFDRPPELDFWFLQLFWDHKINENIKTTHQCAIQYFKVWLLLIKIKQDTH